jgi:Sec-independent protein secretion pathway component TatC
MLDAVAVKSCTEAWCGRAEESRWPLNAGRVGSNQPILFFLGVLFSHFFPAFLWHIFQVERETHSQMTDKT